MSTHEPGHHPAPTSNQWPIIGSFGLFFIALGLINWMQGNGLYGPVLFGIGGIIFIYMLFGWFGSIIKQSQAGLNEDPHALRAFRWGMLWFIFTEIMFFASFFGAFFYARLISVPQLGGLGQGLMTHYLLWPVFEAHWPVLHTPDPSLVTGPKGGMDAWGIPALNTLILIASDMVITWGFWELLRNNRTRLIAAQIVTIALSAVFLVLQIVEYGNAYREMGLKLSSGIYANTFYMLTGVHGTHVLVGIIMVAVIMWRTIRGDFDAKHNFAVAALTWYWHFIDLLWFILFVFVYWW